MNNQDVVDEFYACEVKWMKLRVPSRIDFEQLFKKSVGLEDETLFFEKRRPDCKNFLGKSAEYELHFSKYCSEVNGKLRENDLALRQLDGLLFAREGIENLEATIRTLEEIRNENWASLTNQTVGYTAHVLSGLTNLRNDVKKVNLELLVALEKVRDDLDINQSRLRELLEPTHEWQQSAKKKRCAKCLEEVDIPSKKARTIYEEPEKEYPHYW